ncbi:MAG TPA: TrmJ/YjtD family RNA methyltransferase [Methanothermobacter sp.]|jgi:TrmH family RNA methyltransferase|uniref:RNA methyltransferase n=1 Tax=Methanothermobacter tenebrarum TaxID=680118 RepID=A0ABN6PG83_9EURY|nr:TrmJ/YjtD family RNA methyltransferase [Methanothermobacter tenebrarum]MDD3454232.1 TrmJ/YjtD family RNA methyltransferase [Methanobacteriales archaeon]MDI6882540.1 TrmJ/YjtD family RNA methyltransferase [Methanothermobacter sp.]MDX9693328.1 TrmJ/YjtD family RNA methyltransferase [Methanothermobacter sp.]BDH79907.1 RNA methyltransferase [Methanothermobacter tenebrarum]HHW16850.1 TrmJ/YjtD family RNA methyltransferase [Methanothermobacter sp.]
MKEERIKELENNIIVVFVEPETPGNIGFIARTMKNFGLKKLVLINPCKLDDEAYLHAMHATDILENSIKFKSLNEMLEEVSPDFIIGTTGVPGGSYKIARTPLRPEQFAKALNTKAKIAILFGREGNGLTNDEIGECDIIVSIPTSQEYPIMNVSHAAAIIFYEIFKERDYNLEGVEEASGLEKRLLVSDMEDIISSLGLPDHKRRVALRAFKNLIGRAFITGREAHTLKGIFRRIKNEL